MIYILPNPVVSLRVVVQQEVVEADTHHDLCLLRDEGLVGTNPSPSVNMVPDHCLPSELVDDCSDDVAEGPAPGQGKAKATFGSTGPACLDFVHTRKCIVVG